MKRNIGGWVGGGWRDIKHVRYSFIIIQEQLQKSIQHDKQKSTVFCTAFLQIQDRTALITLNYHALYFKQFSDYTALHG